jgi:hypothetical protein
VAGRPAGGDQGSGSLAGLQDGYCFVVDPVGPRLSTPPHLSLQAAVRHELYDSRLAIRGNR